MQIGANLNATLAGASGIVLLLIIHALQRYHSVYGNTVARELSNRLTSLLVPDAEGRRPCHGGQIRYADDPAWRDLVLFNEYFHADTGRGLGASHQTDWTATIATCIAMWHDSGRPETPVQWEADS